MLGVPELTLVVPTFNERENVPLVVERVGKALAGVEWEIIFVDDDSPDGTAAAVREIGQRDPRVRCIRRVGRRGLAGACIEGMLASQAQYVGVMDADLQHDESVLPQMLDGLRASDADLVIGSRFVGDGSASEGLSRARHTGSEIATKLARRILAITATDPMSGFFMLRREALDAIAPKLATHGFKILADILTSSDGLRIKEVPYSFRARLHGDSKLDNQVALDFLGLLVARATRNTVPVRFVSFLLVGASGVVVHLLVLKAALSLLDLSFGPAQALATFVAMTSNFYLNNFITYADQRLRGLAALRGLLVFYLICAIGAVSNIGVATWLYANRPVWWLAGLFGSIVGAVWNYALSSTLVWRR
ncbi:MAG: dolichol-phosphate mannosyltransferase [Variibacter sp.]|jgi:dolichol-phosphate mannosyltransferase|nr:dolichol-phosphate mannosyltransferase [Variibacter sp.]